MKQFMHHHYFNVAFAAILVSVFVWGLVRENSGSVSVVLVVVCWAVTRILTDGLASLAAIMAHNEDDQQNR